MNSIYDEINSENRLSSDSRNINEQNERFFDKHKKKIMLISIIFLFALILLLIIILIIIIFNFSSNDNDKKLFVGKIECIYIIDSIDNFTEI